MGHKGSVPAPVCSAEAGSSSSLDLMKSMTMEVPRKQG